MPANHACRTITRADEMKWNQMNEMSVEKWRNKIFGRENLPRLSFVHQEAHMEWPRRELGTPAVGDERLTACATDLSFKQNKKS